MLFKYVAPAKQADERSTLPPPAIKIKLSPTKRQPSGPRFNCRRAGCHAEAISLPLGARHITRHG
jgi:hypothetical protein